MSHKRYKANCFSNFNSVVVFSLFVVGKSIKKKLTGSLEGSVKLILQKDFRLP